MNVMVTKSYIRQIQATVFQNEIKPYQGKSSQNELLFSFAYEQKGATSHDETKKENSQGIDFQDLRWGNHMPQMNISTSVSGF